MSTTTNTGTDRQLAAAIVNGATIRVAQHQNGWFVEADGRFLASTRMPEIAREFSSAEAALNAAKRIWLAANPDPDSECAHLTVTLDIINSGAAQ